jgi:hypothetical protein
MSEQKTYINGVWIEQKKFDDGNSILKLSILPDRFIEQLQSLQKTDKGYVRLVVSRRKEVGKNGETHSIYHDTYGLVTTPALPKPEPVAKKVSAATVTVEQDHNEF